MWNIARVYSVLGQVEDTLKTCDQLATLSNGDRNYEIKALNLKGSTLSLAAKRDASNPDTQKLLQAEEIFRRIIKISPETKIAHYNLGLCLIGMHRTNEGITELQTYINESDDQVTAYKAGKIVKNPLLAFENIAPNFLIRPLDKSNLTLEGLSGKVILLSFNYNNANDCRSQFFQNLTTQYKDKEFMLINVGFVQPIPFPECSAANRKQAFDLDSKLRKDFSLETKSKVTHIVIDGKGIIRYRETETYDPTGIPVTEPSARIQREIKNAIGRALTRAGDSRASQEPANELPPPASLGDAYYAKIEPPQFSTASIPSPAPEGNRTNILRIPKPVVKATDIPVINTVPGMISGKAYMIEIANWASFSDEFFMSFRNLEPCSDSVVAGYSSRLEIGIWNDKGQKIHATCSISQAAALQRMSIFTRTNDDSKKVYVIIKDRLTGNSVQSDLVKVQAGRYF